MPETGSVTREILDGYLQLCFATLIVRHPALRPHIAQASGGVEIPSSYVADGKKQSLSIPCASMVERFAREGQGRIPSLFSAFEQLTSLFLIAMWARLKETPQYSDIATQPEVQFLRHARNGCAHGNRFNFLELPHPARWRDKELRMEHNGSQVIPQMIIYGDPIYLVVDIAEEFFAPLGIPGYVQWVDDSSGQAASGVCAPDCG